MPSLAFSLLCRRAWRVGDVGRPRRRGRRPSADHDADRATRPRCPGRAGRRHSCGV